MALRTGFWWCSVSVAAGLVVLPAAAAAQEVPAEPKRSAVITSTPQAPRPLSEDPGAFISFSLENDVFANTDRGYTNGFRFAFTSSETWTPDWLATAARAFPLFPDAAPIRSTLSFGQSLYTPKDISRRDPDPNDRPYAAWLYGSAAVLADSGDRLDRLELQIGVVGPYAIGEQVQNTVHSIIGSQKARGWKHQLNNEPGVILSYERTWRSLYAAAPLGIGFDLSPYVGASLGNVLTQASVGATARLGFDLPADYGPPRIRPSVPGSDFFIPTSGFSWYLFASVEGRAVARNIFLDGNTFEDSPHVTKNPLVGDLQLGIAIQIDDIRIAYTHVYRTQEFEEQKNRFSQYGAFTLSWRF
ncbi:lipid A deacylase LpxR family protein [Inquilinus sp. Marseille-Q2685]|uniref:lipid A deacylase LpxR family protein n=1 Tax=Inquilinus sp. Marseille-Q2685 TaxID=2866581 RepID=UPI001CE42DD9|nr:lipid A deacylase LpxR family protein [Inquilinus sp. Marseille-Q2685]